jgi:hypothetical protein
VTLELTARTCSIEPFRYQATPQSVGDQGASASQINEQSLEDYLNRIREAMCVDLQAIIDEAVSGAGATTFLELNDTPDTYSTAAGKAVAVKATEDGLEFVDFPVPPTPERISVERLILFAQVLNANLATSVNNFIGYGGALGVNGTLAFGAIASGSVRGGTPRRTITSGGAAGQTSSIKGGGLLVLRGNTAGEGGFRFVCYAGTSTAVAQQRAFIGVHSGGGVIGNVNPSTLTNLFGFSYDSAQTTWHLIHNNGAGTADTSVDLGANFPVDNSSWFKFEVNCEPNASTMEWEITNLVTGVVANGSVNAELPVNTQILTAHLWCNNGTTAAAVILEFSSFLLEMVR